MHWLRVHFVPWKERRLLSPSISSFPSLSLTNQDLIMVSVNAKFLKLRSTCHKAHHQKILKGHVKGTCQSCFVFSETDIATTLTSTFISPPTWQDWLHHATFVAQNEIISSYKNLWIWKRCWSVPSAIPYHSPPKQKPLLCVRRTCFPSFIITCFTICCFLHNMQWRQRGVMSLHHFPSLWQIRAFILVWITVQYLIELSFQWRFGSCATQNSTSYLKILLIS